MAKALSSSRASVSEQQQDCTDFKTTTKSGMISKYQRDSSKRPAARYVIGVEEYDKTNEQYGIRFAEVAATLQELVELLRKGPNIDDDILGELFEETEIADQFVEQIE